MGQIKELNIKNQTYYFFNGIIDARNFQSNLLKIDKKPYKDFDIYYIGYIMIKKIGNCKNIHSVNPLYLIVYSATGYFKEKNGEKYLIIDSTEKYKEVFAEIKSEIETINGGEKLFYEKHYSKIGVNTDDDLPLNKKLKFPTLTIIIRLIFQKGKKLYPQVYLDECFYELLKYLKMNWHYYDYDYYDYCYYDDNNNDNEKWKDLISHIEITN